MIQGKQQHQQQLEKMKQDHDLQQSQLKHDQSIELMSLETTARFGELLVVVVV